MFTYLYAQVTFAIFLGIAAIVLAAGIGQFLRIKAQTDYLRAGGKIEDINSNQ